MGQNKLCLRGQNETEGSH